ncbi:SGNH/GDSL hydrolase family protein [Spirosoma sp.]|uniref:SGNH/GDSL hydrolase family protein n=1 Tax=Spirosoma sp. TaxID=1899569 RepID=UPI00261AE9F5|nr:SGNH/GDSL hydrolase family protein [Spirosoma sp.]MCX6218470.1 SGNH/GDSL hydrolase family protein [Spirosoma sp.]
MKKKLLLCLVLTCTETLIALAQTPVDYVWWNPAKADVSAVEGQGWTGKDLLSPYDRLPAMAEKSVRKEVWNLSRSSAGLMIRFRASTDQVVVRYVVGNKQQALPHMPATGVSGVDLYAGNSDGDWLWAAGKYTFGDTIQYRFANLEPNDSYKRGREYRLFLPLYNSVQWLEIGVPKGVTLTPLPVRPEKPVVIYGTSIAQGACASRPGMAWTSILSRKLDRPLINLGFSGNGRLEKEVVDLVGQVDASVYVLDCLPNLIATVGIKPDEIKTRILESTKALRQKRPATPILLVDHAGYTDGNINPIRQQYYTDVNTLMQQAFTQLKAEGVNGVYLLPKSQINLDMDAMVDGTHPTDLGMQQYADAYEKSLRLILNEPVGDLSTMKPRTQYRDGSFDWEIRHREVLARLKAKPPRIIFMGNSITHFWGGEPKASRVNGGDSWNNVLEPLGAQNLGYGWDRVENVLWRVYHGELDGYKADQVVLMIGTNNLQLNTDAEIVAGLKFLIQAIKSRQPTAEVLMVGIFPRRNGEARVATINDAIARMTGETNASFAQPGSVFLQPDGKIDESLFSDGLHPNPEGYRRLVGALKPFLKENVKRK